MCFLWLGWTVAASQTLHALHQPAPLLACVPCWMLDSDSPGAACLPCRAGAHLPLPPAHPRLNRQRQPPVHGQQAGRQAAPHLLWPRRQQPARLRRPRAGWLHPNFQALLSASTSEASQDGWLHQVLLPASRFVLLYRFASRPHPWPPILFQATTRECRVRLSAAAELCRARDPLLVPCLPQLPMAPHHPSPRSTQHPTLSAHGRTDTGPAAFFSPCEWRGRRTSCRPLHSACPSAAAPAQPTAMQSTKYPGTHNALLPHVVSPSLLPTCTRTCAHTYTQ